MTIEYIVAGTMQIVVFDGRYNEKTQSETGSRDQLAARDITVAPFGEVEASAGMGVCKRS